MTDVEHRVGVIGTGFGTAVHVPAFQAEGWQVGAVWSRTRGNADAAAQRFGIPHVEDDWRALVARDDLDAVAIVAPPPAHHAITLAALSAGKHVLCEKPFASSAAQAEEMRDAAAAAGRTAMIAHEFRYAPQRALIKQLIDEGYLGTVQLTTISMLFPYNARRLMSGWMSQRAMEGGLMGAIGTHFVDALRHWLGKIVAVDARLIRISPGVDPESGASADSEDTVTATFRLAAGSTATLVLCGTVDPGQGGRIILSGSDGVLVAEQPGGNPPPDGMVLGAKAGAGPAVPLPMPAEYTALQDDRDPRLAPFRLLVRDFARGIASGSSPQPNFDDGVAGQRVLDAIHRSAQEQCTVSVA